MRQGLFTYRNRLIAIGLAVLLGLAGAATWEATGQWSRARVPAIVAAGAAAQDEPGEGSPAMPTGGELQGADAQMPDGEAAPGSEMGFPTEDQETAPADPTPGAEPAAEEGEPAAAPTPTPAPDAIEPPAGPTPPIETPMEPPAGPTPPIEAPVPGRADATLAPAPARPTPGRTEAPAATGTARPAPPTPSLAPPATARPLSPGGPPAPTGAIRAGVWAGTTSQGRPITFTVAEGNSISSFSAGYAVTDCGGFQGQATGRFGPEAAPRPTIENRRFSAVGAGASGSGFAIVEGTFSGPSAASGTFKMTVISLGGGGLPGSSMDLAVCVATAEADWTASPQ